MDSDSDAINELGSVSEIGQPHWVQHYLYFPLERDGKNAARILQEQGFIVEDRLGADGTNWLVLAKSQVVPTEECLTQLRAFFEQLAAERDGEYDGWEAEVPQ